MSAKSSIESHPQRQRILDALAAGQPYRDIEKWTVPPVTRGTLGRFAGRAKANTRDAIAAIANISRADMENLPESVTRAALQVAVDPFRARIAKHHATLDGEIVTAAGDGRTVAALISADLKGLELDARFAGRLDTAREATNIMIVCPAASASEPEVEDPGAIIDIRPGR